MGSLELKMDFQQPEDIESKKDDTCDIETVTYEFEKANIEKA